MEDLKIIKFPTNNSHVELLFSNSNKKFYMSIPNISRLLNKNVSIIRRHINYLVNEGKATIEENSIKNQIGSNRKPTLYFDLYLINQLLKNIKYNDDNNIIELEKFLKSYEKEENTNDKIIIYDNGYVTLDVKVSPFEETVWLNTNQIAHLFETSRPNITKHINNIFKDNELDVSVSKRFSHTALDGKKYEVIFYNLDMILAIGYRVKSEIAINFRRWASKILGRLLLLGEVRDEERCLICRNEISQLKNDLNQLKNDKSKEIMYFNGEFLRGFIEIKRFLETAREQIVIIDNYFDKSFDDVLKEINVRKIIITNINNEKINECPYYEIYKCNEFHARYIIVDNVCYHSDPSLKDIGNHDDLVTRMNDQSIIDHIKNVVQRIIEGGK